MSKLLAFVVMGCGVVNSFHVEARALTKVEWGYCDFIAKLGAGYMELRYDNSLKRIEDMEFNSGDAMLDKWEQIMVANIWARNPEHYRPDTRDSLIPVVQDDWKFRCINDIAER